MPRSRFTVRAPRPRLTYANVMATIAVFMVLGGGAYAAQTLPRNSVGRAQIRDAAVDTSELARRSVTRSKIGTRAVGFRNLGRGAVSRSKLSPRVRAQLRRARARRSQGRHRRAGRNRPCWSRRRPDPV